MAGRITSGTKEEIALKLESDGHLTWIVLPTRSQNSIIIMAVESGSGAVKLLTNASDASPTGGVTLGVKPCSSILLGME